MPEGREQGEQVGEDLVLQVSGVRVRRLLASLASGRTWAWLPLDSSMISEVDAASAKEKSKLQRETIENRRISIDSICY